MNIGKRVHDARKEKQMTQQQLAEAVGVTQGFINKVERGNQIPSAATVAEMSDALGVTTDWLLKGGN